MSQAQKTKLPKEAVKFAKSMGLDLEGLEPEAEDIWKMLDAMSNSNPVQYEQFIAEQMRAAKEQEDKKVDPDKEKRSFRPVAGFCVCTSTVAGDGLKIRDIGASEGKKLYVNLCSSVVIEEPTDKNGNTIVGFRSVADGLSIPLIVGPVRGSGTSLQSAEKDLFVDVVLNPKVLEMAANEQYFRAQIVDLALDWVIKESGVDCKKSWEFVPESIAKYKGGRGDTNDIPVLFFVDSTGAPVGNPDIDAETKQGPAASKVMSSTASLLSQLNKDKLGEQESVQENINLFSAANTQVNTAGIGNNSSKLPSNGDVKKKPLIQEIGVPDPLLPSGTTEVSVPSATTTLPTTATAAPEGTVISQATKAVQSVEKVTTADSVEKSKEPTKMEYLGMEKLLSSFDEEFSSCSLGKSDRTFMDTMEADSMISNLAKVLSVETSGISPTSIHSATAMTTQPQFQVRNDAPDLITVTATTEQNANGDCKSGSFILTVTGLSSTTDASSMELLVSQTETLVLIDRTCLGLAIKGTQDKVGFGARCNNAACVLQESTATASLKKKKGTLIVKIKFSGI